MAQRVGQESANTWDEQKSDASACCWPHDLGKKVPIFGMNKNPVPLAFYRDKSPEWKNQISGKMDAKNIPSVSQHVIRHPAKQQLIQNAQLGWGKQDWF